MSGFRPSPPLFFLLLTLTSLVLRSSSVHSLTCSSEKFANKKTYLNCTDLSTLNSTLHWTYNKENSSLSIAFTAPPATPNGWIAWAINPTQTGMAGCQTLLAFKNPNGSMTVKTYNISSYSSIVEGKIAFEVPESSAEFSSGVMKIFATVKLPKTLMELNHVWQVGASVTDGKPGKHEFLPANLKATGKLELDGKAQSNGTSTGAGPPVATSPPALAPSISSSSTNAGIYGIVAIMVCLIGFL